MERAAIEKPNKQLENSAGAIPEAITNQPHQPTAEPTLLVSLSLYLTESAEACKLLNDRVSVNLKVHVVPFRLETVCFKICRATAASLAGVLLSGVCLEL